MKDSERMQTATVLWVLQLYKVKRINGEDAAEQKKNATRRWKMEKKSTKKLKTVESDTYHHYHTILLHKMRNIHCRKIKINSKKPSQ